ncbi:alpha/beta hydrolase family protein [Salinarimonas ramus]|uniref:Palmitoyl-protein thioesterase ABHD10, mitochondrial n=1 Tax=Salinarimonas ramus TaxID=690164 RepID=A0A917Q777_9HYPH|nr:alpha/beta fold hydrolase [Salinarimonas ramus]GGK32554.1 alpha/beta hydrolase [Salinarimonas ramus]
MAGEEPIVHGAGDVDLACVLHRPAGDVRGGVVLVHGLGGRKDSETHSALVPRLAAAGLATLRFDFPGHGDSGGSTLDLTIGLGARTVDAMVGLMRERLPPCPLGLVGASFGATAILAAHASRTADALVLRSPVCDYASVRARQLGPERLALWAREGRIAGLISRGRETPYAFHEEALRLDLFAEATARTAPLLLLQGSEDDTVPMNDTLALRERWGGRADLVRIEGGDHSLSDPLHTDLLVACAATWLDRHLVPRDGARKP